MLQKLLIALAQKQAIHLKFYLLKFVKSKILFVKKKKLLKKYITI